MYNGGTYERLEFLNNMIAATVSGDDILQCDMYGRNPVKVGVTLKKYKEATDTLDKYYKKLVELGVIQEEKSSEQMLKEFMAEIKTLRSEIKQLKEDKDATIQKPAAGSEQDVWSRPGKTDSSVQQSASGTGRRTKSNTSSAESGSK